MRGESGESRCAGSSSRGRSQRTGPVASKFQLAVAGDPPESTVHTRETDRARISRMGIRPSRAAAPRCCYDDRWPAQAHAQRAVPCLPPPPRATRAVGAGAPPYVMYVTFRAHARPHRLRPPSTGLVNRSVMATKHLPIARALINWQMSIPNLYIDRPDMALDTVHRPRSTG